MADKTYKMLVTLSNGSTIDAGTFVAPQGPKGDAGTVPEALPQEAGALKSGNLPTSGWGVSVTLWTGARAMPVSPVYVGNIGKKWASSSEQLAEVPNGWQATIDGVIYDNKKAEYNSDNPDNGIEFQAARNTYIRININGNIYVWDTDGRKRTITQIGCSLLSKQTYTISDTSITANSDVLMELTDDGGVKAYSMEAGSITVIRDTVPTNLIPYTYKVKQTNASGQFTLVNHFVSNAPVTSVNGQTGAVTIAVPTKTSQLENDSDYVRSVVPPIVQDVVCNDVKSATTLDTTITCEVGDLILAQIIVRSALTLPTDWTLLRTIPAVETTDNQTLSFAYKRATSTSETLTVKQATAVRIYTNLVRLSNAASISYIQSCEKTNTNAMSISSTKPATSNMVIWGVSSVTWKPSSPYGNWSSSPSTLDYYSLPQATKAPRLGTFVDSSGTGERTFTASMSTGDNNAMLCGAVEVVGDEVARKGDIPTKTSQLTNDSGFITAADIPSAGEWVAVTGTTATLTEAGTYQVIASNMQSIVYWDGSTFTEGAKSTKPTVVGEAAYLDITSVYPQIDASGTLSIQVITVSDSTGKWVGSTSLQTGFKYRKIN